jgi:hypothetical protein
VARCPAGFAVPATTSPSSKPARHRAAGKPKPDLRTPTQSHVPHGFASASPVPTRAASGQNGGREGPLAAQGRRTAPPRSTVEPSSSHPSRWMDAHGADRVAGDLHSRGAKARETRASLGRIEAVASGRRHTESP